MKELRAELTPRGLILGVLITLVFTAANVYFGLKAGLTFATSIPAAVISMAALRALHGATIQENNIVQTVASAAGTLSSIIFVLPGMVMIGWWSGFPYWVSCAICVFGGILGVMYSIPLRRALVTQSDLPYPEGVACAEVLKCGSGEHGRGVEESRAGLAALVWGSVISGAFALIAATRVFASDVARNFRVGERAVSGFDFFLSFALFGIGHLVGLWVGVAMGVGALIGWVWGVPHFSALSPDAATASLDALAHDTWSHKVRFVGAGTIGVAAIWTLAKLVKPVVAGLRSAMVAAHTRAQGNAALLPRTEQDIPIGIVGLVSLLCVLPAGVLLAQFVASSGLGDHMVFLVVTGVLYIAVMSFLVSAVCGYMAGLISALAQGVIQNNVDWSLIETGGLIGVVLIGVDALVRRLKPGAHLSPLAVGLGIYLPTQSTLMVVVGAVAGWIFERRADVRPRPEATKQLGVLLASGMIVGEGLVGVLVAALVAFSGQDFPLSLVSDAFANSGAVWLGAIAFAGVIYLLYRWLGRALVTEQPPPAQRQVPTS